MYMPRWFLHLLAAAAVIGLGWFAGSVLSDMGSRHETTTATAPPRSPSPQPAPSTTTTTPAPVTPVTAPAEPPAESACTEPDALPTGASTRPVGTTSSGRTTTPRTPYQPPSTPAPAGPPPGWSLAWVPPPSKEPELTLGGTSLATTGSGNLNVIAQDGSIVLVGDNAQLNANTGPVSEGGILAIEAEDSDFTTRAVGPASQEGSVD